MRQGQGQGEAENGGGKRRSPYLWLSPLLRVLQLFAAVCAFAVMVRSSFSPLVNYSSFHATRYLIAATVIAAFWALVMLIAESVALCMARGGRGFASNVTRIVGDFMAATLALSAGSAVAGVTTFNDQGGFPYSQTICQGSTPWTTFCSRSKASTALAFITFFLFLPSVFLDIAMLWLTTRM